MSQEPEEVGKMDLLRRNSVGQTGGVIMGTEMGNWQSAGEHSL